MNQLKVSGLFKIGLILFSISFLKPTTFAQSFADPEYFLVDTLDFRDLDEDDSALIVQELKIYHSNVHDTIKLQSISNIIEGIKHPIWEAYNDVHYNLAKAALKDKSKLTAVEISNLRSQLGASINNIGYCLNREGETWKAISYFKESLKFFRLAGDSANVSRGFIGLSTAYHNVGEIDLSNQMDQQALAIAKRSNDLEILCIGHKNLAMKLMMNSYLDEALENALLARKYSELQPDNGLMRSRAALGVGQVYSRMGEDSLAAIYFSDALDLSSTHADLGTFLGVLVAYGEACKNRLYNLKNEGKPYGWLKDSTLKVFQEVLDLSEGPGYILTKIRAHKNLGHLFLDFKENKKALHHADMAYFKSLEISNLPKRKSATYIRYRVLSEMGRYKEALEMLEEFNELKDQTDNSQSLQIVTQNKMKLQYTVQATKDSLEFAASQALAQKEIENQNDRIKADKQQKWILYSGLGLVGLFSFFLFKKFRQTQHQNKLIQHQKEQIVEAHSEVRASIEYAKRLQTAILPKIEDIKATFKDSFVLFEPKDIVSGDFYWFEKVDNQAYIAAADCTGHGVPGAMVSVVCSNALHQALHEFDLTAPADILNKTRELVIDTFAKSGDKVKDGMDIALCRIDLNSRKLVYAGANNPLWILRANETDIEETKANKQPVGLYEGMTPFIAHETQLNTGDAIFLFTDGYADQFGGEKGKKMKYKPFKKLLVETSSTNIEEQSTVLSNKFKNWRGELEQIDDVCVIGVRV